MTTVRLTERAAMFPAQALPTTTAPLGAAWLAFDAAGIPNISQPASGLWIPLATAAGDGWTRDAAGFVRLDFATDEVIMGAAAPTGTSKTEIHATAQAAMAWFVAGDAQPNGVLGATAGSILLGPGGAVAPDWSLARFAVDRADMGSGDILTAIGTGAHQVRILAADAQPAASLQSDRLSFGAGGAAAVSAMFRFVSAGIIEADNPAGTGLTIQPAADTEGSIGTAALRWGLVRAVVVTAGDLELHSPVTGAHLIVREATQPGEDLDSLFVENRRTGQRFALNLARLVELGVADELEPVLYERPRKLPADERRPLELEELEAGEWVEPVEPAEEPDAAWLRLQSQGRIRQDRERHERLVAAAQEAAAEADAIEEQAAIVAAEAAAAAAAARFRAQDAAQAAEDALRGPKGGS